MKGLFCRSVLLATSMLVAPAFAAETTTTNGIQEIVVTAQRSSQSVLSVPLSIQAITGATLNNEGIRDISQLQFTTPGFTPIASTGYTLLFIRGVGNSLFVGADPSVTTFVDDVPRIYGSMVTNFVDVQRIEVLKGAQGGLYGRNATGGVVNIITHQPNTDAFSGSASIDYGEKNTFRAAGYMNIPVNDKVAVEIAAERDSHDPYIKDVAQNPAPYTASMFPTGQSFGGFQLKTPQQVADILNSGVVRLPGYGNQDFWSAEGKVLLKMSDNFKVTIAGDYSNKADTIGNQDVNTTPAYTQALFPLYLGSFGIQANLPANFFVQPAGKFTTAISDSHKQKITDYGASVTAVWSLPGVDLTSISALRYQRPRGIIDIDSLSVPFIESEDEHYLTFFYQELRGISTGEGPWHFLGGATFLRNRFVEDGFIDLFPPLGNGSLTSETSVIKNWSVYAQAGYDFTQAINLTVSGRYIHETNNTLFVAPVVSGSTAGEKKFLPSATLSYKFDGGGNAYARWARGFKAGGVNPVAPPSAYQGSTVGSIFGPEIVDTYEVGYRAPLFDHKVQLTTAAFYNNYRGLQVSVHAQPQFPALIYNIVNAGNARTYGAEETLQWQIIEPLTVGISAGYLNAKYKNFKIANSPVLEAFDLSNTTMLNSPKFQLALTADLDQPLNDKLNLVGNVLVSHTSSILYSQSGLPGVLPAATQPAYWLTNARMGVRTSDGKYEFAIYANNLFNQAYYTYGSSSAASGNVFTWGNPRIIGGEISVKF